MDSSNPDSDSEGKVSRYIYSAMTSAKYESGD